LGCLSDDDRRVLEAAYGRTQRQAAEVFGLSKTAYRYRLKKATERARELQALVEL
jgi:DNA-binding Lrp family transcriptional regulator